METDNKSCIIIHGSPDDKTDDSFTKHWIPWIKKNLEKNKIPTQVPFMPHPHDPVYEDHKRVFERLEVNEDTVLIGHSDGAAFLVRWLGETKVKIDKLILIAPWKIARSDDETNKAFFDFEIDESIGYRANEVILFSSNTGPKEGNETFKVFQDALEGEVINLKGHGHYTEEDMGTTEFPELLEVVLREED